MSVLVQISVGGQAARLRDESVPLACGCIGQETTGAGGFAKALRTVPVALSIAEEVRRRAASDAWIVDFTNPVGIVTRSLLDHGHRAVGLCNVAIGFERQVARELGVEPERVAVEQVGLNHLTWVRAVRVDGRDVLPELLEEHLDALAAYTTLSARVIEELGVVPSYNLRYFYAHDDVLEEQRSGPLRAEVVAGIERDLHELYRDPGLTEKPALLEQRGGAFYSDAATRLVASLVAGTGDVQVVDTRNEAERSPTPGMTRPRPLQAKTAAPARHSPASPRTTSSRFPRGADGPVPVAQAPLAPELRGLVQNVAAYERLTARAAVTRDERTARLALLTHPLIGQFEIADELLRRLLAAEVPA